MRNMESKMRNPMCNHRHGRRGRGGHHVDEAFESGEFRSIHGRRGGRTRGPGGHGFGGGDDFFGGRGGRGGFGMGPGMGAGMGGGRGPGMRGGRRKRLFDQTELQALLLALIVEAPRHGYDLIREIETLSGGDYAPSPGVVYPALTYMEESGLIAVMADDSARKSYEATDEGRKQAEADAASVTALKGRLSALAEARDKVDPAPVRRAMQALKTSLFDRLSRDGANRDLVLQIADAIDEATRKIERIEA